MLMLMEIKALLHKYQLVIFSVMLILHQLLVQIFQTYLGILNQFNKIQLLNMLLAVILIHQLYSLIVLQLLTKQKMIGLLVLQEHHLHQLQSIIDQHFIWVVWLHLLTKEEIQVLLQLVLELILKFIIENQEYKQQKSKKHFNLWVLKLLLVNYQMKCLQMSS